MKRAYAALMCWAASCGGDPRLDAPKSALAHWDEAESAAAAGDARRAEAAWNSAWEADPQSAALARAVAHAAAKREDWATAIRVLTEVEARVPLAARGPVAWDRAVYRIRQHDIEGALADVRAAQAAGVDPRAMGADSDLALLAAVPEGLALLPLVTAQVADMGAPADVLSGEEWEWTLRVVGPPGDVELVPRAPFPDGVVLRRVVEDVLSADAYEVHRQFGLRFAMGGTGPVSLPALDVRVGAHQATLPGRRVERVAFGATAQEGKAGLVVVPVPSSFATQPSTVERKTSPNLSVALWPAHLPCQWTERPPELCTLEYRVAGQPVWSGGAAVLGASGAWRCGSEHGTLPKHAGHSP